MLREELPSPARRAHRHAAEIDAVAKAYRVYVKNVPDPKSTAGYTMDHSAFIYVMGPDGAYRTHFTLHRQRRRHGRAPGQAVAAENTWPLTN